MADKKKNRFWVETEYAMYDKVYLTTDVYQYQRIVIGFDISPNGITYLLRCGEEEVTRHYEDEISETKDTVITPPDE
jgi:hypothetical protein